MTENTIPLGGVLQDRETVSIEPAIYEHWLQELGLPGRYVPISVAPPDLKQVLKALPKMGFVGLNICRPYQRIILDHADIVTDRAAIMSGANTIIFQRDGRIQADNTDGYGFLENIRQVVPGWNPKAGPAAVFGAGRAAREVVTALLEVGTEEIRISSRNRPKAEALRTEFGTRIEPTDWVRAGNIIEGAKIIVNTTPLGSEGHPDLRVPLDALAPGTVVSDLTLNPPMTRLLQIAMKSGCYPVDGVGMILNQAAPVFERWYGKRPEIDQAARNAVARALMT
ncbi:MAG: shikimate dehydrogenase [Rhodobacterales bacterium]|nr:MAG: shikimate dehydrogenase [Rhodobacterales bacterium]